MDIGNGTLYILEIWVWWVLVIGGFGVAKALGGGEPLE